MAYCLKCGAYIPDGQTVCLACGYDPDAEERAAEAARAAQASQATQARAEAKRSRSNADLRQRLEEQRRRSQEQNRQWAEQERMRREEQAAREEARRKQQEEDRRWARQEYERRQAEQRADSYQPETAYRSAGGIDSSGEGNKALAALSYLSVLFALPYIFTPQDRFAKFHAKQGLKLFIFGILADILGSLIGFAWIVTLARLYLIYKGMSNALNGRAEPLPYIGTIGDQ